MTVTTPPADPGGRPASDRWVTILAACSVLCTVVALVCLGLLVFTGDDKGSGSSAASSGTSGTSGASADEPSSPEESRPDNLTDAGWSGSTVQCKSGDSWIYAATGAEGQVLVCLHEQTPYLVDAQGAPDKVDSVWPMCPAKGHDPALGRFTVAYGADGWRELDGPTMYYYMYMNTGQRTEKGAGDPANVDVTRFDDFWVEDSTDYSSLASCDSNHMTMEFRENPDQADSTTATDNTADNDHGVLDLGPDGDGAGAVSPTGKTILKCEFGLPAGTSGRAEFTDGTKDFDPVCERIRDEFYAKRPYICGESDSTAATAEECEARGQKPLLVYDQPQNLWGNDPRYAPNRI